MSTKKNSNPRISLKNRWPVAVVITAQNTGYAIVNTEEPLASRWRRSKCNQLHVHPRRSDAARIGSPRAVASQWRIDDVRVNPAAGSD
jgi:hypothetical protein